jgi:hypothetical protein
MTVGLPQDNTQKSQAEKWGGQTHGIKEHEKKDGTEDRNGREEEKRMNSSESSRPLRPSVRSGAWCGSPFCSYVFHFSAPDLFAS